MFSSGVSDTKVVKDVLKASSKAVRNNDTSGFDTISVNTPESVDRVGNRVGNVTDSKMSVLTTGRGRELLRDNNPDALNAAVGVVNLSRSASEISQVKTIGDVKRLSRDIIESLSAIKVSLEKALSLNEPIRDLNKEARAIGSALVAYAQYNMDADAIDLYDSMDSEVKPIVLKGYLSKMIAAGCWPLFKHLTADLTANKIKALVPNVLMLVINNFIIPEKVISRLALANEINDALNVYKSFWYRLDGNDSPYDQTLFFNISQSLVNILLLKNELVPPILINGRYYPEHYHESLTRIFPSIMIYPR